jgi:hypothetical protein
MSNETVFETPDNTYFSILRALFTLQYHFEILPFNFILEEKILL